MMTTCGFGLTASGGANISGIFRGVPSAMCQLAFHGVFTDQWRHGIGMCWEAHEQVHIFLHEYVIMSIIDSKVHISHVIHTLSLPGLGLPRVIWPPPLG